MEFETLSSLFKKSDIKPNDSTPDIKKELPVKEKTKSDESEVYKSAKNGLIEICQNSKDPNERITKIIKRVSPIFKHIDRDILPENKIQDIQEMIDSCSLVKDDEEFINLAMKALKPLLDIREAHSDKFEEPQPRIMNETGGFIEINRLLSYGKSGSIIHIHAPAGESIGNKFSLYRNGMIKLAVVVNNDPEIQEITATSHLVASHPKLFTMLGFEVNDITKEFKEAHFIDEEKKIKTAKISRQDFLSKFLKN